jgi:V-ATPase subunit C
MINHGANIESNHYIHLLVGNIITGIFINVAIVLQVHVCHRFIVRDFQFNQAEIEATRNELTRLTTDKKNQFVCCMIACCNVFT